MRKKKTLSDLPADETSRSGKELKNLSTAGITSRNAEFSETLQRLNRLVETPPNVPVFPILLLGPSGVGKTFLARTLAVIRNQTSRCRFVEIPCGAVRGNEFPISFFSGSSPKCDENQPFSEEAFQFRNATWENVFEMVSGGILFLKEIEFLSPYDQELLLHFLDVRNFFVPHTPICLISSASTDLHAAAREGRFSSPLLTELSVWTFSIPPLARRSEDISDLIFREFHQWKLRTGQNVSFDERARGKYLGFAESMESIWNGNFRDLRASLMRMIALSETNGSESVISIETVSEEIGRLKAVWAGAPPVVRPSDGDSRRSFDFARKIMGDRRWEQLDRFDKTQLADVLLVCRRAQSLSEAGRILFSSSRLEKSTTNDTDRLRKYLLKFGVSWNDIQNVSEDD